MAIYTFGIFQLNTQTIKLHRGDEELELEPQVFNTLQYLVENHDRVVTKDELFEEVWHGRTLTDHVITRIIYELRKTLDDKSVDNSTIRTVRGKGYRFIAPVAANQATGIETKLHQENEANNTFKKRFIYPTTIVVLVLIILIMSGLLHLNKESETGSENKTSANVVSEVYQILSVLPIDVQAENDELAMLVQSLID